MARRIRICAVCGAGMGTSFLAKMAIEKISKKMGYDVSVETVDVGSAAGMAADIYVTTEALAKALSLQPGDEIVVVSNFIKGAEIEKKLTPVLRKLAGEE